MRKSVTLSGILAGLLSLSACESGVPEEALQLTQESLVQRQLQTRRFDTENETQLLQASVAVLQDLGYQIGQTHSPLGFVFGEKEADATELGQIIGAFAMAMFLGANASIDKDQTIRVSIISRPLDDGKTTTVRATFQRIVRNSEGRVSKVEALGYPELYQEFFERLSKAVFLEANPI